MQEPEIIGGFINIEADNLQQAIEGSEFVMALLSHDSGFLR